MQSPADNIHAVIMRIIMEHGNLHFQGSFISKNSLLNISASIKQELSGYQINRLHT